MTILTSIPTNQHRLLIQPTYWGNLSLTIAWSTKYPLRSLSWRTFLGSRPNSSSFQRLSSLCPTRHPRSKARLRKRGMKNLQKRSKAWTRRLIHSWDPVPPRWTGSRLDLLHQLSLVQHTATLSLVDNPNQLGNTKETNPFSQMNMKQLQNSLQRLVIHSHRLKSSRRKRISSFQTIKG